MHTLVIASSFTKKRMAARTAPVDPKTSAVAALAAGFAESSPRFLFGTAANPGFLDRQGAAVKKVPEFRVPQ
jgi:hypothetical protein